MFWLGSSGWATFGHGDGSVKPKIICPNNIIETTVQNKNEVCHVTGAAWSPNAGWIIMGSGAIGGNAQGVYYNPNTANLEGFGWSKGLGWVPIFTGVKFDDENLTGSTLIVGG